MTVWRDVGPARLAARAASALLTAVLGVECRLVWQHDMQARATDPRHAPDGSTVSLADGFPALLASRGSLADLDVRLAAPVPVGRFRPNLVVEGSAAWDEDRWRRLRIGDVVFSVARPRERCVVTTIDPRSGERPDPREPLRTLATFRRAEGGGVMFGQNLVPESLGALRVGDAIEILERGPPNVSLVVSDRSAVR